jgi:hypothetical protein
MAGHAYDPSYSGIGYWEDSDSSPVKKLVRPHFNKQARHSGAQP